MLTKHEWEYVRRNTENASVPVGKNYLMNCYDESERLYVSVVRVKEYSFLISASKTFEHNDYYYQYLWECEDLVNH